MTYYFVENQSFQKICYSKTLDSDFFSLESYCDFVVFATVVAVLVTCLDLICRICFLHDVKQFFLFFVFNSYFHFISLASQRWLLCLHSSGVYQ